MKKACLLLIAVVSLFSEVESSTVFASQSWSGITNGSFEIPAGQPDQYLSAGTTILPGWQAGGSGGPVYWSLHYDPFPAANGVREITFNRQNAAPGSWIAQTLDTVVSTNYEVLFQVGRTGAGRGSVSLTVSAKSQSGKVLGQLAVEQASLGFGSTQRFVFTAESASTTIEFLDSSSETVSVDVLLDNVVVHCREPLEQEPVGFTVITNGSFEIPAGLLDQYLSTGDTLLPGWRTGGSGGPVYWPTHLDFFPAANGAREIIFNRQNTAPGSWIAQTFDTIIGAHYEVLFQVGRTGNGGGSVGLTASAKTQRGKILGQLAVERASLGFSGSKRFIFTAESTSTTLEFLDSSSATISVDVLLDNVVVHCLEQRPGGFTLNGVYYFALNGPAGSHLVLQVSSNLLNWSPLLTNTIPASGTLIITDPVNGGPQRFFRAVPQQLGNLVVQPGPIEGKDIWTTSFYSYAPGGSTPGGGQNEDKLTAGGWDDLYFSLLQFDLTGLPASSSSAVVYLYCSSQFGGGTTMYLDRITQAWDWRTQGTGRDFDRLWWADRPATAQWSAGAIANPTAGQWYSIDITSLYNAWKNGTHPNYGLQLRPVNNSNNNFNNFYSADSLAEPLLRPKLVVAPGN